MKKSSPQGDDVRPEYDFVKMKGRIRGKYAKRYRAGTNVVFLEPDVYAAFPTSAAVNQALRAVLAITESVHPRKAKR
jgi:hypothetical protein